MKRFLLLCLPFVLGFSARAAEFDAAFDWYAAGQLGTVYDPETQDSFSLFPGDYVATASLERRFRILTFRTQIGAFLYEEELPSEDRETAPFVLFTAMDRFGEDRWALIVLGGGGYYDATGEIDFHAGLGFDYRVKGPWMVRGEAVYHHEFESVAISVGGGYLF